MNFVETQSQIFISSEYRDLYLDLRTYAENYKP
jgi:hypothetical protein